MRQYLQEIQRLVSTHQSSAKSLKRSSNLEEGGSLGKLRTNVCKSSMSSSNFGGGVVFFVS